VTDPQKVIVYRSQMEQVQDEFWMAHPEIAMIVFGLFLLAFGLFFLRFVWTWFSFNKHFNRIWKDRRLL
jgi:NhaP-type Na+/H+ or K+/H+ antiporter